MDGIPRNQSPCGGLRAHPTRRHVSSAHTAGVRTRLSPSTGRLSPSGRALAKGKPARRVEDTSRTRDGRVHRLDPQQHPPTAQPRSLGNMCS